MFGAISHTVETHGNSDMSAGYVLNLTFPLWTVACGLEQKTHVHRLCFLSP